MYQYGLKVLHLKLRGEIGIWDTMFKINIFLKTGHFSLIFFKLLLDLRLNILILHTHVVY